jgi:hypothetical protein
MADASSGLAPASLQAGQAYRLTGVAGQRSSRKGALDGYRIWLRDVLDLVPITAPGGGTGNVVVRPLGSVATLDGATVVVEGRVTAPATLLDATGRRVVIQDATGAVEVLLPLGAVAPPADTWVRVSGTIGRAYDAPRLRATQVDVVPVRSEITPAGLHGQPGATLEWRLAVATGTVVAVTRLGARWHAELDVQGTRILVDGLPGAAIPSTAVVKGQRLTVLGIVRRPYPGATERRFSLVPRVPADLRTTAGAVRAPAQGDGTGLGPGSTGLPGGGSSWSYRPVEMDLATIEEHAGAWVRIGGLVTARDGARLVLDDGTAMAPVRLAGEAAAYIGLVVAGDAVNVVGIVVADPVEGWEVLVTSADGLVRVGALGQSVAIGAGSQSGQLPEGAAPGPGIAAIDGPSSPAASTGDRPAGTPVTPVTAIILGLAPLALLATRWVWIRREQGLPIGRRIRALVHAWRKAA